MGGVNYACMEPLWVFASIGVDCFVMITGYFMIDRTDMRWNGILKTWVQTLFYTIGIMLIAVIFGHQTLDKASLLASVFPMHQSSYWFVTHYIALLFLAPFFARLANALSKRLYQWLLIVLFVMTFSLLYGTIYLQNMHLGLMTFLFFVAGYIRKYSVPEWWKKHAGSLVFLIWGVLIIMATAINIMRCMKCGKWNFELLATENNGPVFFLAVTVFVWFVERKPWSGKLPKLVGSLGAYTFGIYLIHQNFYVNDPFWTYAASKYNMGYPMILHALFWTLLVFISCACIDYLRAILFSHGGINRGIQNIASKLPKL